MLESGEEPIWIELSPFTRNKRRNAYPQFEFGHHKHDHVERIESFESRLECHHSPFLCGSSAVSPEHMAAVMSKHRRWWATWLSRKVEGIEINDFSREKIDASVKELNEEREAVKDLLS